MKIAVLGTRGFPKVQGGVEVHSENLYTRLVTKGCEVVVFTRPPYVDKDLSEYKGVKLISLSCPKNKFFEAIVHTFKSVFIAKKIKPDIVHIHASGPSLCVPMIRMLGMKVVMTSHGPEHERKKWAGFPKYILMLGEWLGVAWANAVISISVANAERLKTKFHKKISFIPNGVVISEKLNDDGVLRKYGLDKGKYIFAVGRFVPEKGLQDLIGVAVPEGWKIVIAGKADHEDKYSRQLKRKAKANSNIVLTGFIAGKTLQELYSHAGLFVLPSYYEGLPIALLEAMSYGLSCIVSDILQNREVELAEDRFFKVGDIGQLTEKIKYFINKPLTLDEKNRQIAMVTEQYDWDKIAEKTLKVYKEALEK